MVYRELASLQKCGVLTSVRATGERQTPQHRPPKRYSLIEDRLKEELAKEVRSFLLSVSIF